MLYTLGQAAKAVGKAKGTIKNAIDKGRISASKNEAGEYQIDPSELHRVYPLTTEQSKMNAVTPPATPPLHSTEIKALEDKVRMLETALDDARQDRDEWRKQAQQLALAPPEKQRVGLFGLFRSHKKTA